MASAVAVELSECKAQLTEVVDEVLHWESEFKVKSRHVLFLQQALADSIVAHARVQQALQRQVSALRRGAPIAAAPVPGNGRNNNARKAEVAVHCAMDDLRGFQISLQRSLADTNLQLPPSCFVQHGGASSVDYNNGSDEDDNFNGNLIANDSFGMQQVDTGNRAEEALALLEHERVEWARTQKQQQQRIKILEEEVKRQKSAALWPFKDDHRSAADGFGMSSNTTDVASQQDNMARLNNALMEEGQSLQQEDNKDKVRLEKEIIRMKNLLDEQQGQAERQCRAVMQQAEEELKDAEMQIMRLRKELNAAQNQTKIHGITQEEIEMTGMTSPTARRNNRFNGTSTPTAAAESFSLDLVNSNRDSVSTEQYAASLHRLSELQGVVARLKADKDQLRRSLDTAMHAKEEASEELQRLELDHGIGVEAIKTERGQCTALRDELDKAHRDREVASREQKAGERRHQALVEEMEQVLEERDKAVTVSQVAARKYVAGAQELEKAQIDLQGAVAAEQKAIAERNKLENEKRAVERLLDAEKRRGEIRAQDIAIVEQQKTTVTVERDAAVDEQYSAMKRVDAAVADRKAAFESRDRALASVADLQDDLARSKVAQHRAEQQAKELTVRLKAREQELLELRDSSALATGQTKRAEAAAERAKEERVAAEQEMELAQRQCRAIGEELRSVLRVRDIALKQRDHALRNTAAEHSAERAMLGDGTITKLLPDGNQESSNGATPDEENAALRKQLKEAHSSEQEMQKRCKELWIRVDELEVSLAAVEEEKQDLRGQLRHERPFSKQLQSRSNIINGSNNSDIEWLGTTKATVDLFKKRMVDLSRRMAELQQTIRAGYINIRTSMNLKTHNNRQSGSGSSLESLRDSTLHTAIPSSAISDILATLSKQLQSMETDGKRQNESIHELIECARTSNNQAEHFKREAELSNKDLHEALRAARANSRTIAENRFLHNTPTPAPIHLTGEDSPISKEIKHAHLESNQTLAKIMALSARHENKAADTPLEFSLDEVSSSKGVSPTMASTYPPGSDVSHVTCEHRMELLKLRIKELETEVEAAEISHRAMVQRLQNEIDEERLQLKDALQRLKVSDDKVLELKKRLRSNLFDIERLEAERDRLSAYVEDASSQLRGVANQKTNVNKELDEVYSSLTALEKQLLASHSENRRLKQTIKDYSSSP